MTISEYKLYPAGGDTQTIYLKNAITDPGITVGDYTVYNDFVHDPRDFQKNSVLYHYPVNHDRPIRKRFSDDVIARLLAVKWWDWPEERIRRSIPAIQNGRIRELERQAL